MASNNELEQQIKLLTSEKDGKEAELWLLQSEFTETVRADKLLSEQSGLFIEMMDEYLEYYSNRKETEKSKASKARLMRLMYLNNDLSMIGSANYQLKLINKNLQGQNFRLRKLVATLNNEIIKSNQSKEF